MQVVSWGNTRNRVFKQGRRCIHCGKALSVYNPNRLCFGFYNGLEMFGFDNDIIERANRALKFNFLITRNISAVYLGENNG